MPGGEFTLVQDEFDITEGMDVTLWMQPVGTSIEETVQLCCHPTLGGGYFEWLAPCEVAILNAGRRNV